MSSEPISNPYQPDSPETLAASAEAQRLAASIARWQRVMAVLLLLASVLMIGSFAILVLMEGEDALQALGPMVCSGIMVLLCYVLPAVLLWRAADSTSLYSRSGSLEGLHGFIHRQLVFWRTLGILIVIAVGLWLALVFVALFGVAFIGSTAGILAG